MKSLYKLALIIYILFIFLLLCSLYIAIEHIGTQSNDIFAIKQEYAIRAIHFPDNIKWLDSTQKVGKIGNGDEFVIWTGIAVSADLSFEELTATVKSFKILENAEIVPYESQKANELRFTGVQKELEGNSSEGCYLIWVTYEPVTNFDSRNR